MSDPGDCLSILPKDLDFGVISSGFIYTLKFHVRNNLLAPIRIHVTLTPQEDELNLIRLLHMPDKIAPGMSTLLTLELIADYPTTSMFILNISQSHNKMVFTRVIEALVVNVETFKHVKRSLQLQKRPIYNAMVQQVGSSAAMHESLSLTNNASSSDHLLLMDEDDIEDVTSFPQAPNVYWDPFSKVLRVDPELGRISVGNDWTLEQSKEATKKRCEDRLNELEEQGFYTYRTVDSLRNPETLQLRLKEHMEEGEKMLQSRTSSPKSSPMPTMELVAQATKSKKRTKSTVTKTKTTIVTEKLREGDDEDNDDILETGDRGEGTLAADEQADEFDAEEEDDGDEDEDEEDNESGDAFPSGNMSKSQMSQSTHIMSVTSLLAMKREKVQSSRRQSIMAASAFAKDSQKDTKINSQRSINMINNRQSFTKMGGGGGK